MDFKDKGTEGERPYAIDGVLGWGVPMTLFEEVICAVDLDRSSISFPFKLIQIITIHNQEIGKRNKTKAVFENESSTLSFLLIMSMLG